MCVCVCVSDAIKSQWQIAMGSYNIAPQLWPIVIHNSQTQNTYILCFKAPEPQETKEMEQSQSEWIDE